MIGVGGAGSFTLSVVVVVPQIVKGYIVAKVGSTQQGTLGLLHYGLHVDSKNKAVALRYHEVGGAGGADSQREVAWTNIDVFDDVTHTLTVTVDGTPLRHHTVTVTFCAYRGTLTCQVRCLYENGTCNCYG